MAAVQPFPEAFTAIVGNKVVASLENLTKNRAVNPEDATTYGNIINRHGDKAVMYVVDRHNWHGNETKPYPEPLPWTEDYPATFEHQGPLPGGSKAAVVYSDGGDSPRQWIVAFDRVKNKAYIEVGQREDNIDWKRILDELDASKGPSQSGGSYALFQSGGIFITLFSTN